MKDVIESLRYEITGLKKNTGDIFRILSWILVSEIVLNLFFPLPILFYITRKLLCKQLLPYCGEREKKDKG